MRSLLSRWTIHHHVARRSHTAVFRPLSSNTVSDRESQLRAIVASISSKRQELQDAYFTNPPPEPVREQQWQLLELYVQEEMQSTRYLMEHLAGGTKDLGPSPVGALVTDLRPDTFTVGQYNILASYLGKNTLPWFLYGIDVDQQPADSEPTRRERIFHKFYSEGNNQNGANGYGWPFYVDGILTTDEMETVQSIDNATFCWEKRKWPILASIKDMDVDVLSMVEVDHHETFFKHELSKLGYDSVFRKRPRDASADGCAIYWKRSVFTLRAKQSMDFLDSWDPEQMRHKTDRTCLCVLLEENHSKQPVIFVSVHLARNPEDPEQDKLRGKQMAEMVFFITNFAKEHNVEDAPVIVCGDVNATNYNKLRGIASLAAVFGEQKVHPFIFEFQDVPSRATSVTSTRRMRIDAILYQKTHVDLVDLDMLPMLSPTNPIPNHVHPSDHLPMKATFRFKTRLDRCLHAAQEWWTVVSGTGFSLGAPLNHKELSNAFMIFDYTGTNKIDLYSLKQALQQLRIHSSPNVTRALLQNGDMNYAQFCMRYLCSEQFVGESDRNVAIHEAFTVVDVNNDHVVSAAELVQYFETFEGTSLQVTEKDLSDIFCRDPETNQLEKLTYAKFCVIFMMKYVKLFFPERVSNVTTKQMLDQFENNGGVVCWEQSRNFLDASKVKDAEY